MEITQDLNLILVGGVFGLSLVTLIILLIAKGNQAHQAEAPAVDFNPDPNNLNNLQTPGMQQPAPIAMQNNLVDDVTQAMDTAPQVIAEPVVDSFTPITPDIQFNPADANPVVPNQDITIEQPAINNIEPTPIEITPVVDTPTIESSMMSTVEPTIQQPVEKVTGVTPTVASFAQPVVEELSITQEMLATETVVPNIIQQPVISDIEPIATTPEPIIDQPVTTTFAPPVATPAAAAPDPVVQSIPNMQPAAPVQAQPIQTSDPIVADPVAATNTQPAPVQITPVAADPVTSDPVMDLPSIG